jgi:3-methyladenine DNA glycosylase/8-oxoguanine DNA glycosylase
VGVEPRTIPIDGPLDLRETLRPLHGRFAQDGWWLAARTPEGAASLRVRRTRAELVGESWGEGSGWLLQRLGAIAGLNDDPAAFATDHPIVGELHRRYPGRRFGRTDLVFRSLLIAICGQKVTGTEAGRAMRGLTHRFSEPAPGPNPGLRLPPDPERLTAAPYHDYHQLHLEKRRADLIRRIAGQADRIDGLADSTPGESAAALESFLGIGEWTRAKTLEVSHGDPDQVPVGDFHMKHMVVHHLTGEDRGTDEEMVELLEEFRPHRGRVLRLLHSVGHEPKFGPRMAPRNITTM